ncbi:hypothetical protein PV327_006877 [Microctonus hyperodae]|uniref:Uncharacterized protein n=1 Tax=Microctonus hyperodae TaxID=165561 RepID=A0AA39F571_MICHY|nr:hypothetical protein PV327_006877 [Microctonus hyperodae]
MDMFEDDDIFDISDDEMNMQISSSCNPVDDYLIKQLHDVQDRIEQVNKETLNVQSTTKKILLKLYEQCRYFDDNDSSDSDDEWYDENGKPVAKRKKIQIIHEPLLEVTNIWQRIIDDKWVIGVDLKNNSERIIQAPKFYVMIKNENELKGVISLWQMNNNLLWNRITNLSGECEKIAATAVLNLPNFQNTSSFTGFGTIIYQLDGKELQTPIGTFELNASQAADKLLMPRFAPDFDATILAIKAVSIEKIITISLEQEPNCGVKLLEFLERNDFIQVMPDVHMSNNPEIFRHCIFEILSLTDKLIKLRISTRSMAQLNIILHMVGNEFPDTTETARVDKIIDGVIALENELKLKLECDEPTQLLNARIATDLLIPHD